MKIKAIKSLFFLGLLSLLASCQQMDGQSLLSNESLDDTTLEVDRTPKSEELFLTLYAPTVNSTGKTSVDIAGDCFISTYPKNDIIVTYNGSPIQITDYNTATPAINWQSSCKNGRFDFALKASAFGSGSHSLRVILRVWDVQGNMVTNDAQGAASLTLTR